MPRKISRKHLPRTQDPETVISMASSSTGAAPKPNFFPTGDDSGQVRPQGPQEGHRALAWPELLFRSGSLLQNALAGTLRCRGCSPGPGQTCLEDPVAFRARYQIGFSSCSKPAFAFLVAVLISGKIYARSTDNYTTPVYSKSFSRARQ